MLGIQAMLYVTPKKVVVGATESSTPKVEHKINPVPGILGLASLTAGVGIFVTKRRADEPEAKNAVK